LHTFRSPLKLLKPNIPKTFLYTQ